MPNSRQPTLRRQGRKREAEESSLQFFPALPARPPPRGPYEPAGPGATWWSGFDIRYPPGRASQSECQIQSSTGTYSCRRSFASNIRKSLPRGDTNVESDHRFAPENGSPKAAFAANPLAAQILYAVRKPPQCLPNT